MDEDEAAFFLEKKKAVGYYYNQKMPNWKFKAQGLEFLQELFLLHFLKGGSCRGKPYPIKQYVRFDVEGKDFKSFPTLSSVGILED